MTQITVRPRWTEEELGLTPNGTFAPVYTHDLTGDIAVRPAAYHAMRLGYGCTGCYRYFGGSWLAACPDCGRRTASPVLTEQWW